MKENLSPWNDVVGSLILGATSFVLMAKSLISNDEVLSEIPRQQRYLGRPQLEDLFANSSKITKPKRDEIIRTAYFLHGYTLKAIADYLGKHYTTISKVINSGNKN
jgi:hypothetical protein